MDIDKAREILTDMRLDEDIDGIYSCSERENTALWMAGRALEICKENGLVDYQDFVERGRKMPENNFDKLLGKNGELLQERQKQVLDGALEIIRWYYKDKPNKMEVIAALFGKKLNKRFMLQCSDRNREVMFTPGGLDILDYDDFFADELGRMFLEDLLTGEATVIND